MPIDLSRPHYLVGSGCGMNLFSVAGAVNELLEAGVPIKGGAATSGSTLVFAAVFAGLVGKELEDTLCGFTPITKKLFDPAWDWRNPLGMHGLVRGKKLEATVNKLLADKLGKPVPTFADLKLPLSVYVGNVTKASANVYGTKETPTAPVAPNVVNSCRIPGAFQSSVVDGSELVDGGMWKNFPIDHFGDGEDVIGLFFQAETLPDHKRLGLGYWPRLIDMLIWAKTTDDIEDAPKAVVIDLPGGSGMDFGLEEDEARLLVKLGRDRVRAWLRTVK
jgi:predicted acylesterase/phospholipase RssA